MSPLPLDQDSLLTHSQALLAPGVESAPPASAPPAPAQFPLREREAQERPERALRRLLLALKVGVVLLVVYGLVFNFSIVRGSSMSPGIHDGDRILVNHLSYLLEPVKRGDIVVLRYPLDPRLDYIKRVIGLPGDLVVIRGGFVSVNGEVIEEPYISEPDPRGDMVVRVTSEHYFVMGDNRPHSSDSREFGQVPRENLVGKVDLRIWPPSRLGVLE
ncbi:MAG: signal peptidase I [Planctomycetes bacterium]|nr:signal peptidase I [Planctomycetota bacterium]